MALHRPRKSGPTEYTTDEEDIMYDVEEPVLNPKYVLNMDGFTDKGELVKGHNSAFIRLINHVSNMLKNGLKEISQEITAFNGVS
ncbi:hypothetical protein TNCV_859841 [Trichonephila clavipes]|nr:hypothetical protein TNCV_859841 [Trichonephila clavipes]